MTIAKTIGDRLRIYRVQKGWSQEVLAEYAKLHPTYIGQLERGEKNATLESISKIAAALDVPLSKLFENISLLAEEQDIPARCYALVQAQSPRKQEALLELLNTVIQYEKL